MYLIRHYVHICEHNLVRDVSVKSAARVLDLLQLLASLPGRVRVNEVARLLGIPKSSASSLLATLEGRGYVEQGVDGFRLSTRLHQGWVGGDFARLMSIARSALSRLVAQTEESAFLGVLTAEWNIRYVQKVVSDSPLRYDVELGTTRAAYCTSIGHVLLAGQSDSRLDTYLESTRFVAITPRTLTERDRIHKAVLAVRRIGYASSSDSHVLGASGIAAPVSNAAGQTIAGLAVIAPSARFAPKRAAITRLVVDAAAELSRSLAQATACAASPQRAMSGETRTDDQRH